RTWLGSGAPGGTRTHFPVMPRWLSSPAPPRNAMSRYFPRLSIQSRDSPCRTRENSFRSLPRKMRLSGASALAMRRPPSQRRSARAANSTSGSSGMQGLRSVDRDGTGVHDDEVLHLPAPQGVAGRSAKDDPARAPIVLPSRIRVVGNFDPVEEDVDVLGLQRETGVLDLVRAGQHHPTDGGEGRDQRGL